MLAFEIFNFRYRTSSIFDSIFKLYCNIKLQIKSTPGGLLARERRREEAPRRGAPRRGRALHGAVQRRHVQRRPHLGKNPFLAFKKNRNAKTRYIVKQ